MHSLDVLLWHKSQHPLIATKPKKLMEVHITGETQKF